MSVQTIPELFLTAVRENPRPDCFSYRDDSGQYVDVSSEEALRRVKALRMGLKSLGVQPGDKVALLSENRIEWAWPTWAAYAPAPSLCPSTPRC